MDVLPGEHDMVTKGADDMGSAPNTFHDIDNKPDFALLIKVATLIGGLLPHFSIRRESVREVCEKVFWC